MADVSYSHSLRTGLLDRLAMRLKQAGERLDRYRVYRQTLSELEALSDRDLADLSLSRHDINRVAREAAAMH